MNLVSECSSNVSEHTLNNHKERARSKKEKFQQLNECNNNDISKKKNLPVYSTLATQKLEVKNRFSIFDLQFQGQNVMHYNRRNSYWFAMPKLSNHTKFVLIGRPSNWKQIIFHVKTFTFFFFQQGLTASISLKLVWIIHLHKSNLLYFDYLTSNYRLASSIEVL